MVTSKFEAENIAEMKVISCEIVENLLRINIFFISLKVSKRLFPQG